MHEKEKATHCECVALKKVSLCASDIAEEQSEHKPDTAKIAKKIADYVRELKPRLLISANEAIFASGLLADLKHRFPPSGSRSNARNLTRRCPAHSRTPIVLVDHDPIIIDVSELRRKVRCCLLAVRGADKSRFR